MKSKPSRKSSKKTNKVSFGKSVVSPKLFVFVLAFAVIGGFLLIKSFAASTVVYTHINLVTANSVGASVVKDTDSPNKNNTNVVELVNPAGATTAKAVLADTAVKLDTGEYKACLNMRSMSGTVSVTLDLTDATSGVPGTTVATASGAIPANTKYAENLCVTFTNTNPNRVAGAIVSNKTAGGTMRAGNVAITKTGEVATSCLSGAGSNRYIVNTANGFENLPSDKIIYEDTAVPNNRVFDANGTTWNYNHLNPNGDGSQLYSIKLWKGSDVCWSGGRIISTLADTANSDWQAWHDLNGFRIGGMKRFKFEGVYVRNFGDLINITDNNNVLSDDVSIKDTLLRHSHDDCIQNDKMASVMVKNSLLDGCYSGISARFSDSDASKKPGDSGYIDGSGDTFTVEDSLVWMQPVSPVYKGTNPGHGGWFKWENVVMPRGMKLKLKNVTLMARQNANHQSLGNEAGSLLTSCDNLTILWTGSGTFPGKSSWQSSGCTNLTILEGQAAKDAWIAKVNAWYAAHPQFNDLKQANSVYF